MALRQGSPRSRVRWEEFPGNGLRGEIYAYIRFNPGDSYADIKRNLLLSTGPLVYHLSVLERGGLIRPVSQGSRKRFYAKGIPVPLNGGPPTVQNRILAALLAEPGMGMADIASEIGVSRQVALYHVRKLACADLVRLERQLTRLLAFPRDMASADARPAAGVSAAQTLK